MFISSVNKLKVVIFKKAVLIKIKRKKKFKNLMLKNMNNYTILPKIKIKK